MSFGGRLNIEHCHCQLFQFEKVAQAQRRRASLHNDDSNDDA